MCGLNDINVSFQYNYYSKLLSASDTYQTEANLIVMCLRNDTITNVRYSVYDILFKRLWPYSILLLMTIIII